MRTSRQLIALAVGLVLSFGTLIERARPAESGHREVNRNANELVARLSIPRTFGQIPLSFSISQGQADPRARFTSQGPRHNFLLTPAEAVLTLSAASTMNSAPESPVASVVSFKMRFVGGNRGARVEGLEELPGKSNYLIGKDTKKWRTNVPTYARVKYREVYPGVDVVYYGNQQQLEYDLVVAPRADPRVIKVSFKGAESLRLDTNGDIVYSIRGRELRHSKPVVFQELAGRTVPVEGRYAIKGRHAVGFVLGPYDRTRPLVIDPVLVFSTTRIACTAIAVDNAGHIYLTTSSPATPGTQVDAFVSKLNPSGTAAIYSTYLGGSGKDSVSEIAVDAMGNASVAGMTDSADFPTTRGAQATFSASHLNAFVATLNSSGSDLITSTHLTVGGGPKEDNLIHWSDVLSIDSAGNAYVGGFDEVVSPVIPGIVETSRGYLFVRMINSNGIAYSFRFSDFDAQIFFPEEWQSMTDIDVDSSGNAYVLASTAFSSIVTTPGAIQPTHSPPYHINGGTTYFYDSFVMKLSPNGSLIYSTYIAGTLGSFGNSIAADESGNAYLAGKTASTDFPVTQGAFQTSFGGGTCGPNPFPQPCKTGFLTKLNASGTGVLFSTYSDFFSIDSQDWDDRPSGIAIDGGGNVYLTGGTQSAAFPTTEDAVQRGFGGGPCGEGSNARVCNDAFLVKFNPSATALLYATYLGGNNTDGGHRITVDPSGNVYLLGHTESSFPATEGAYKTPMPGNQFIVRFAPDVLSVSAAHFNVSPISSEAIVAAFGAHLATYSQSADTLPLPTSLVGSRVMIKDSAGSEFSAPLFFVSPTQINYQVPEGIARGPAVVTVTSGDGRVSTGLLLIAEVAPALFTLNQSGSGAAAALDAFTFLGAPFSATRPGGQPNIICVFGTGLGADATGEDGIDVSSSVEVTIDGTPVTTILAGSAPGYVGLNQFNVVLPDGIRTGVHSLVIARNGIKSNLATIAIR